MNGVLGMIDVLEAEGPGKDQTHTLTMMRESAQVLLRNINDLLDYSRIEAGALRLEELPFVENSNDFVFDSQMLAQCDYFGYRIGEVSCPTKYFPEASSINFWRSLQYGLGVMGVTLQFLLQTNGLAQFRFLQSSHQRIDASYAPVVIGEAIPTEAED